MVNHSTNLRCSPRSAGDAVTGWHDVPDPKKSAAGEVLPDDVILLDVMLPAVVELMESPDGPATTYQKLY